MALKKHHKIMIGGLTTLIIISLIIISILLYSLYIKQGIQYSSLTGQISELKENMQSQINLLSTDLVEINTNLEQSQADINLLKASGGDDFSGIYSSSVGSVVIVSTNVGQGTGFFIAKDGYILTNYHVVDGATAAGIYTSDGKGPYQVSLIGSNQLMDIALLKIDGNYNVLEFGDSNDVQVGEKVIAIGNPYGLQFSATTGSVSQVHREGPNSINAYIQIDAAINPGNSGGPLIDKTGKVIGIVNFKIGNAEGLGFALESDYIKSTVNSIAQEELGNNLVS